MSNQWNEWFGKKPKERTLNEFRELEYPKVIEIDEKSKKLESIREYPSYIALEITNVCNLTCTHCNYRYGVEHYTRDRGFIEKETVIKVFEEIKDKDIPVLMNYDGESLIHKEFLEYLELAEQYGIKTYFNSNATRLTEEIANKLVSFYKGSIFFSMDGNKEWFEKIRKPAKFEDVVKNIEYFIKVNKEAGSPIDVGISLCNLGQNIQDRKEFYDYWMEKGINYISMGEVNDKNGHIISDPMTVLDVKKRPVCSIPWQTLGIGHDGSVIPCSIYITRANTTDTIFGNIHETSIKEIWNSKKFDDFRKMLAEETFQGTNCEECQRWYSQFQFPNEVTPENIKIERNGYWTTFTNLNVGELKFKEKK